MVIQRWQSVMLLIAGIMMGLFSFLNIGQIQTADYSFMVSTLGIVREGIPTAPGEMTGFSTAATFAVSLLSMILPLIAIFCFKNTPLQKRVVLISVLFTIAAACILGCQAYSFSSELQGSVGWFSVVCAPFIAVAAEIAAWRLIIGDEKKLRAANRLR